MRISYVNGAYVRHQEAQVHIEDRGYQFSDGVYEYIAFYNRKLVDADLHLKRLQRSLQELKIDFTMSIKALSVVIRELIARNGREDGGLYIQITRGVARRDHPFPKDVKPALVMTVCASKLPKAADIENGMKAITTADIRWQRRDIKSLSLLANILAKQEAVEHHAREAWLIGGDHITEGSASNAYIVGEAGEIITHPVTHAILGGITREIVLKLARDSGIKMQERAFTMADVRAAKEAFITSTSANVLPIVKIDDITIGNGKPGAITHQLQELYVRHIFEQTGKQL